MDNVLETLRTEIDEQDRIIIDALCRRFELSDIIGEYKKQQGIPVYVPERETAILNKISSCAGEKRADVITEIYRMILMYSRYSQEKNNG